MASVRLDGEILTAARWEATASASSAYSFTQIGQAFTICDLHALMVQNPNTQATPNYIYNAKHPSIMIHKIGSREA